MEEIEAFPKLVEGSAVKKSYNELVDEFTVKK
jgi:hypothetical protein